PIISAVKEILQHQEITKSCIFDYQEVYTLVEYHSGVSLKINNYNLRCNIMLASIIGNWPKNCKSCLTYSGTSYACSCHICLVGKDDLNVINLLANRKITRTEIQMRQAIEIGQGKDHLLHEETNSFWNHPYDTIVESTIFDLVYISNTSDINNILGLFTKNDCQFLKFHHWIHHTIETIEEYGNLNGLSAETYESLVESYERDEGSISEILEGLCHLASAMSDYFKLLPSMIRKDIEKMEAMLILYESFTLSNKEQVRATKDYYNAPMFSDVAILWTQNKNLKHMMDTASQ
ncbi:7044_t:CDS:2, partial [Scutellospora calospora]